MFGRCHCEERSDEAIQIFKKLDCFAAPRNDEKYAIALTSDKRPVSQFRDRLLQFGLRVHHDRPGPGGRLLDRLAGDEQKADAALARLYGDLVAAVEHDERAVAGGLAE